VRIWLEASSGINLGFILVFLFLKGLQIIDPDKEATLETLLSSPSNVSLGILPRRFQARRSVRSS
jgi:hypothetical protein